MTYTEKELDQFLHGISLSLLSKKSAQHWRYDEETAKEIEWLEVLERKVRADKADRKTENSSEKPNNSTISKMEQVDEPQTVLEAVLDRQTDEDRRKMAESVRKAIKDEPQTERYCTNCKHNGVIEDYECRECNGMDNHEFIEPQIETSTNSSTNLEKLQLTDEPQTCSVNGRPYSECSSCEHFKCTADEQQTDCPWK